jgi:penicillin-binding protein 1A
MKFILRLLKYLFILLIVLVTTVIIGIAYYTEFVLPNIDALNTVQLQVPLQILTHDGKLIAQYGEKRRIPLPYNQIPKTLIDAVLATEDQRYFQHPGIDIPGLVRAAIKLALTGRKEEGGSTITMQVARSFYLTRHKTFGRKLREILLALKIDHRLSKEKILELYLNKIFLGARAYGVEAAAEIYYGKPLNQLSLDEFAMIAGLPKAPSALNPITYPDAAKKRRDHVLSRMYELGYINQKTYQIALAAPLKARFHDLQTQVKAPYVAELVRQQLEQMYGDAIYTNGFIVYSSIDSRLQNAANQAVQDGLIAYDQRHGYRGPEQNLGLPDLKNMNNWEKTLNNLSVINNLEPAAVVDMNNQSITVLRANGNLTMIPWSGLSWARKQINADYLGPLPKKPNQIVKTGDVIRIIPTANGWRLAQTPKAEAGMIVLDPQNGQILAMVGGFDFQSSKFNRITSAQRQPGSSFKPFIYSAAFDKGYTLASVINDAPIVVENLDSTLWRPQNDTHKFYGPTRLRDALIHSRNLVSIRLLQAIGLSYAINYTQRFGFTRSQLPPGLSLALGTANVTPLQMAAAYAVFANGGFKVVPYAIDSIRTAQGNVLYQAKPSLACDKCTPQMLAKNPAYAPQVISPQVAYLVTTALRDVILHGTASAARSLQRSDLAGKTGTTQNQVDAWFVGYSPELVSLAWAGFDQPQSLHEHGAQAALPIWMEFMGTALQGRPEHPFEQPPNITNIKIDPTTGARASENATSAIFEYFMEPYLPETAKNPVQSPADVPTATENGGVY